MFIFQLENDRRTVETSLLFNVNIFSEIRFKKLVVKVDDIKIERKVSPFFPFATRLSSFDCPPLEKA